MVFKQAQLSTKELLWQGFIFLLVVFTAFEVPFSATFKTELKPWQVWTDAILCLAFLGDLIYRIKTEGKEKLESDKNSRYLWYSYILLDAVACIPFDMIAYSFGYDTNAQLFYLLRLVRLVRILKIFHIMNQMTIMPRGVKIPMMVVVSFICVHWIACAWSIVEPIQETDYWTYYNKSMYWAFTTLTTIGYGDITPTTNVGRVFTMFVMILGVGVYGVVIGNVSRLLVHADRYKEQTKEKLNDLAIFMKHYHIPKRLQDSVFSYYNHLYTKRLSENDAKIIGELPQALQKDLKVFMNMKLISSVPIFKGCSISCLKDVSAALEQHFYSPGQNIINIGEVGHEMFIIGHGQAEVILQDGNAVAQINEGQFFGEIALLEETTRNANVRASSYCDLYKLDKEDFLEIIKKHPKLLENMEGIINRRKGDRKKPEDENGDQQVNAG